MGSIEAVMLVMTMLLVGARADEAGCQPALMKLSPCLNYISGKDSSPLPACCLQFKMIVQTQPLCLCYVANGDAANKFGITINPAHAQALPGICKVPVGPVSNCNQTLPSGPTDSPGSAVSPTPSTDSGIPLAGTESKSSTGSKSNGSMTKFPIHLTLFLLFITSSVSAIIAIQS